MFTLTVDATANTMRLWTVVIAKTKKTLLMIIDEGTIGELISL